MFGTVSGIMMALFLDNVGGAWDNAKKYVEVRDSLDNALSFTRSAESTTECCLQSCTRDLYWVCV